jgi:pyruvate dehydrogenase E2 component (dihydrolipoamide acetyltransferase)
MRYIFKFPDIGEGLDEGIIAEWYVEKGAQVEMGQPLVKMETDKVVTDIPSPKTGTIAALYGRVGETVHVGSPLVEFDIPGGERTEAAEVATKPAFVPVEEEGGAVVGTLEVADNSAYLPASGEAGIPADRIENAGPKPRALATPVARAMARELGVDIDLVTGTGPAGRVTKADIELYVTRKNVKRDTEDVTRNESLVEIRPLSQMRKVIARNMIQSKHNAAHMTVFDEVEVTELIRIRTKYKEQFAKDGLKLSYLPFILKATALALQDHPVLNAELDLDQSRMIYKKYYNLGIAVDTEEGLVVPVVRNVDRLTIRDITRAINQITEKARNRSLILEDMKDGTFTLTNFGSIGGQFAVPVINYPQAGILGIGRLVEKPVVKSGAVVPGTLLPLSLSVDHRMVDGGEVARFLNRLMEYLSDPVSIIIG